VRRERRYSYSLRARVAAAAALVAAIIMVVLGVIAGQIIQHNNIRQIDRELETAAQFMRYRPEVVVRVLAVLGHRDKQVAFAMSLYQGDTLVSSTSVVLPPQPVGSHTVEVNGERYRMFTVQPPDFANRAVSFGMPVRAADQVTSQQRHWLYSAGALSIAAAAGLGWLVGGRAVRPIVELTHQVSADPPRPHRVRRRSGVREADELADAVGDMLRQVADAQAESASALAAARDFASASAHELRTPLTAMRTDLEVLRTLDLDPAQRAEILADLARTQGRVEATLTALQRLATGELTSERDYTDTDVGELCDLAAYDAMRHMPGLTVKVDTDPELVMRGLPAGLRLAVDNALTNSVKHGSADHVEIAAHRTDGGRVVITVDDDGRGLPAPERVAVFARFVRGAGAAKGGSGLGLSLVAQQAQLHGGSAYFEDSPLGGVRLVLDLPDQPAATSRSEPSPPQR
jgi:two-component system sensor histidine kinase PrrB